MRGERYKHYQDKGVDELWSLCPPAPGEKIIQEVQDEIPHY